MKLSWITAVKLSILSFIGQFSVMQQSEALFFPFQPPEFVLLLPPTANNEYDVLLYIDNIVLNSVFPHVYSNMSTLFTGVPSPSNLTQVNIPFTRNQVSNIQAQINSVIPILNSIAITITVNGGPNRTLINNALFAISSGVESNNFGGLRTTLNTLFEQLLIWALQFSNNQVGMVGNFATIPPNIPFPPIQTNPSFLSAYLWIACLYGVGYQVVSEPTTTMTQIIAWYNSPQFQTGIQYALSNIGNAQIFPHSIVNLAFSSYNFVNQANARGNFTQTTLMQIMPPLRQAFIQITPQ